MATQAPAPPPGYEVWRQSKDYLYGWNWRTAGAKGWGYGTKRAATAAAHEHARLASRRAAFKVESDKRAAELETAHRARRA